MVFIDNVHIQPVQLKNSVMLLAYVNTCFKNKYTYHLSEARFSENSLPLGRDSSQIQAEISTVSLLVCQTANGGMRGGFQAVCRFQKGLFSCSVQNQHAEIDTSVFLPLAK